MSSRFEFLGNTIVGQYIPRDSWFHKRDPRARLIGLSLLFLAVLFTPEIGGLLLGFIGILLIYWIAMLPVKSPWKSILRALPFILILAVLQIIFLRPDEADAVLWTVFGFTIAQSALMSAVMLVCRFIVLIWVINVFVMSISTSQMTAGLFHLLKPFEIIGFPVNDLTMVVQITLRYLPMLAQLAEKTAKAQASRGGDWDQKGFNPIKQAKRVLPLIVPLLVNSLKRAETMALAMESRGFNAGKQRSSFYSLTFTWGDMLFVSLSLVVFVVMILFRRLF